MTPVVRAIVRLRRGAAAGLLAAATLVLSTSAGAQVRRDTTTRRDSVRAPGDTVRAPGDSLRADSTAKVKVEWAEPDSVMSELLSREGYTATKYQGQRVELRAKDRTIKLEGKAAVGRPDAVLIGDTVVYNDSLDIVTAAGRDTTQVVLQDPTGAQDDIRARRIVYDINARRGKAFDVTTSVNSGQIWVVHGNDHRLFERQLRREAQRVLREGRLDHELYRLDAALPLRREGDEGHLQGRDGRAASSAVHRGRPGVLAAVRLSGSSLGPAQRHHPAAVRHQRHRARHLDLSPDRRGSRLLLRAQRLLRRAGCGRLAERRRRDPQRSRVGSLEGQYGLPLARTGS